MKRKEKKLTLVIAIAIVGVFTSNGHAQVTIGSGIEPHPGALLDLKTHAPDANNVTANKGLLLPRVALTDLDNLYPMFLSGYTGYTKATEDARHIGLAVYNITDDCSGGFYKGVYVWDGTIWQFQSQEIPICPDPAEPTMINVQGNVVCSGGIISLEASADEIPNPVFKWYDSQSSTIPLATGATYAPGTIATLPANFYVSVSGTGYTENAPDNRKVVTVTEAPTTTPTPVVSIVDNKQVLRTTRSANTDVADFTDLTTSVSVTPELGFTYSWTVTKLYATGVDDVETAFNSYHTDNVLNGTTLYLEANANGVPAIGGAYKVEVTATSPANCSTPAKNSVNIYVGCGALTAENTWSKFMCHNLEANQTADPFTPSRDILGSYFQWGSKEAALTQNDDTTPFSKPWSSTAPTTFYGSDGTTTGKLSDKEKSITDPCPDGYRVPTYNEWSYLRQYNTPITNNPSTTWLAASATTFTGRNFGGTLFLPAAGSRASSDGGLVDRGSNGYYWSTALSFTTVAYNLNFSNNSSGNGINNRPYGYSVRCIAQ